MSKSSKLNLDLELESGGKSEDHPAKRMFSQEPVGRHRLRSITNKPDSLAGRVKAHTRATKKITQTGADSLKRTDRDVLEFLIDLRGAGRTCVASNPEIAVGAKVSERQVQISIRRLIDAHQIERVGYDFGNPDREKRGTTYKILV